MNKTRVILKDKNYVLPVKTLSIVEKIEQLLLLEEAYKNKQIRAVECFTAEYNFIVELLGNETVLAYLGTQDLQEVDIDNVSIAAIKIIQSYNEKIEKAQLDVAQQKLNSPIVQQAIKLSKANKD